MPETFEPPLIPQPRIEAGGFLPLLEFLPDGVVIVDENGRVAAANAPAESLFGYEQGELIGVELETLLPESSRAAHVKHRAEFARAPRARAMGAELELAALRKDGSEVPVDVSLGPFRTSEGLFVLASVRDVTARRQSQERSAASEALLAQAQRVTHLGSWEWRIETDELAWSDELYRIFGLEPGSVQLSFEEFLSRVHPDDRERVQAAVAYSAATGEDSALEYRIVVPDGGVRWLRSHRAVERDADRPLRMFGTALDVTEQKQVEQRLRDAETRYRTLLEQLPLAFYIRPLSLAEPNIYVSPQVEAMLGYPADEWLTDAGILEQIVHPDDREKVLRDASRVRKNGAPLRAEYRYVAADGRVVWTLDETYLVTDESGEPYAVQGFLLDITERKEAEAERDRLLAELYHAQRLEALGRLAGGVAHDFNNMLTAIEGYSELLLQRLGPESPLRLDAEEIRRAAGRASSLTRHLLAFSRRQTLEPQLVDLNEVVSGATNLLERLIGETVHLRAIPGATEPFLLADPAQVEQVLLNLVLNARDAMPADGTLTIETENVELAPRAAAEHGVEPGPYVALGVTDTGAGMDAHTRERIFDPFFTTKDAGKGSGLGLSTVYGTVRQSGGFIRVDSTPGRGSRFEIFFPAAERGGEHADREQLEPPSERGEPATILVVEDEEIVRRFVVTALAEAGHTVLSAANGAEALALCEAEASAIDILLTDVVMPGLGGRELAEQVRALRPGISVVLMSGYTETTASPELDGRPVAFLDKPFSPAALLRVVRDAVARRPPVAEKATR